VKPWVPVPLLPNAPITEALIDLRAELPANFDVAKLAALPGGVASNYPTRKVQRGRSVRFDLVPGGSSKFTDKDTGTEGFHFVSRDGRQVVQMRKDGFTFNRLRPYAGWEPMRDEAHALWVEYTRLASPLRITRAAIRTINRIEIPLPIADLAEYLRTLPEIAPALPQGMSDFFMRLVIQDPTRRAVVIVTEAIEPIKESQAVAPLVFDVDVFREAVFPVDGEEVWSVLEELRQLKDAVFFESMTEKAMGLFQ
jgi:uncharacterized protein (TIGR04255 family)